MTDIRKSAFDAARRVDDDGALDADDIEKIHAALDAMGVPDSRFAPDAPSEQEQPLSPTNTGKAGKALIKAFEGCARKRDDGKIEAYPDPGTGGEPWTIGWGSTGADPFNGGRIRQGTVWTQAQADEHFERHLVQYEQDVIRALGSAIHTTSQAQFDALVSFHYNTGAIGRATLTRKHKAGDFAGAAREFDRWTYAAGRVMKGLARRRAAERSLYEGRAS